MDDELEEELEELDDLDKDLFLERCDPERCDLGVGERGLGERDLDPCLGDLDLFLGDRGFGDLELFGVTGGALILFVFLVIFELECEDCNC